ncbi:beta-ketoacyl-ACP synthase III [Legionella sp. W05-934-2]|jgi:3-oxoacyl-[acyl-carrier-protein] synthase-3|uniref:beta-ketoacyl-ACP synthase III n=1 Tax=Legionella sp. W05-934-2 TaxID=1198649 RepID=UPI0034637E7E
MIYASIHSTGAYLPNKNLHNDDLPANLETNDEWIYARTGIHSRYIANEKETTAYMAEQAALDCMRNGNISPTDVDMIIAATCSPSHFFPSAACFIQKAIGAKDTTPAFDLNAACSGFVYALDVASQYIQNGKYRSILVVGSETMSKTVNWNDRSSCILFGDGAGAALVTASDSPGIIASRLHAKFDQDGLLNYDNATHRDTRSSIHMQGNEVFKLAVLHMEQVVDQILADANMEQSQVDWLIPHQANKRIIMAIAKRLNLPMSQVILTIETQGNTSAASIPLTLHHAVKNQQVKRGDTMLLESFGGGMTWGAMLIKY